MDSAVAGTVDLGRYGRRIVRMIWDPEPTNDVAANTPVWCLGCSYVHEPTGTAAASRDGSPPARTAVGHAPPIPTPPPPRETTTARNHARHSGDVLDTPPDSVASSAGSSLVYGDAQGDDGWPPAFLDDFESRLWMTYRSGFKPIRHSADPKASSAMSFAMRVKALGDQSGFSSDSGWGCMIRSGQSLLANALAISHLGRHWRRSAAGLEERRVISLFADDVRAPYSIHNFVNHGAAACGKFPGEWFGPSATAQCIKALVNQGEHPLRVYSTGDLPDVYEDAFLETARPDGQTFRPTLILVGTRLGIDKVNRVYWESLSATLQMPQSVGIAGGRPAAAHYFVGVQKSDGEHDQGSYLFYLDPHYTRPALPYYDDPAKYSAEDVDSCHTRRLRCLHIREMDPSMLIGFLIRNEDDWINWRNSVQFGQGKAIITVSKSSRAQGLAGGREGAIDEVETFSDEDGDTVLDA